MATSSELKGQLLSGGYSFPFDISGTIDYAARHGLGTSYILGKVYSSPEFKSYFPGIFRSDGSLRMSPAAYQAYADQAQSAARSAGFSLTRAQVGTLVTNQVSADEFAFRIQAASTIKANTDVLHSFNNILKASGFKPIKSAQEAFKFLTGKANEGVYRLYEAASIQAAAHEAGIELGNLQSKSLAKGTVGVVSYEDAAKGFAALADARKLSDVELAQAGLTKEDQARVALGTADAKVTAKFNQVVEQRKARLSSNLAQQQGGIDRATGRPVTGTSKEPGY